MQPVRTDHEVEFPWGSMQELDMDASLPLGESGNGVPEDRLDASFEAVMDCSGEV
ncbi:hypothetical protein GCM10009689_02750 [Brevibacterium antiquum]